MNVPLRNGVTGEIKFQKIGWSWTCFFFSTFFGIPLFIRKLYAWAALMAGLCVLDLVVPLIAVDPDSDDLTGFQGIMVLVELGFSIFFGLKANTLAGKQYLENGWVFAEPGSSVTTVARQRWGLLTMQ